MIHSKKRITKALIRLRGCAGCSAPVLFAPPPPEDRLSRVEAHLSSRVPAKPDIAKDLLKAHDISRKAMEDFIALHLVEKSVGFYNPMKRNKLKTLLRLARSRRN